MLKALVVGYGSIGKRHIENLSSMKNIEIIVCTKRKYDKFLKQKKCKIYASIEDCIKENPKFAIIANETRFHSGARRSQSTHSQRDRHRRSGPNRAALFRPRPSLWRRRRARARNGPQI